MTVKVKRENLIAAIRAARSKAEIEYKLENNKIQINLSSIKKRFVKNLNTLSSKIDEGGELPSRGYIDDIATEGIPDYHHYAGDVSTSIDSKLESFDRMLRKLELATDDVLTLTDKDDYFRHI